jgi:phage I-like protein
VIRRHAFITVPVDAEKPPTEFCLIHAGVNESENGPYNYDEKSRKTVMEGFEKRGIDCMFDWHHASLDPHPFDPRESIKAAGWYKLEDRPDGLWATEIKWTPAALESFANKEIRYFSPAFDADKSGRVIDYINCALTNLPATHNNEQLIAAARKAGEDCEPMTDDERKKMESLEAEVAKHKKAEEKREESSKAAEEAKKNAKPPAKADDEDEEDEDEESPKRKAKKSSAEDEDEESRKMSVADLNSIIVKQSIELAQLKANGPSDSELTTRVNAAIKAGVLAPALKRWALANRKDFDTIEKSTKSFARTEHRMPEETQETETDTAAMKLAREIGAQLGNTEEQIQRGFKAARTVK